jgi:virginiamycin B lyase
LAALLVSVTVISWAQSVTFTEYTIPTPGSQPTSITAGPDGALWFTEYGSNRIGQITTNGVITEYTIPTPGSQPTSITAGPDGALWFLESGGNKIGRISTAGVFTEYTTPPFPLNEAVFITQGPDGALWFINAIANVGRITTAGEITGFAVQASGGPNGIYPGGITAGPDGALWYAWINLPNTGEIGRISTAGAITEYATKNRPGSITAGPDGALWFTESILPGGGKIGRITTAGAITEYDIPTSAPIGITAGPDGALWFTEAPYMAPGKIGRITTAGVITEYTIPTPGSQPGSIAAGPDGALWFTDTQSPSSADKIGRAFLPIAPPLVSGIVNGASFLPDIAAGAWITIQGTNLSATTRTWSSSDFVNGNLPTNLDGVSATVNGVAAYVYYISSTQLNVLAPDDTATGQVQVQVTNFNGTSNSFAANESAVSPAFFLFTSKYPAAVHTSGVLVGTAGLIAGANFAPAKPGENILVFGTGFGPTNPPLQAGKLVTTAESLANTATVTIGGQSAKVLFAGLSASGLDQLNVTIPAGLPDGDAGLVASVGGVSTQANLFVTIQH